MSGGSGSRRPYRLAVVNSHPIQYFAPLYRRLAKQPDIDPTVYYCSRAGAEPYEDEGFGDTVAWDVPLLEGYRHVFLPNLRGERAPSGFWSLVNVGIVGELRRARPDAVWIHGHAYASHILAVLGARAAGSALFMRCDTHLGLERPPVRQALRTPAMTAFYRLFDGCLAIGTRNAEFYRRHGVPEDEIFHVPYAVDNDFFHERSRAARRRPGDARERLGFPPPEVPVVLFAGKLVPWKRPMDVLRAHLEIRGTTGRRAALAYAGDGPEREALESVAERHDAESVHFLGFRNQSEMPAVYGTSDVLVLPSESETWGLVVNEAMCAGLPVIASDAVGAAADLVSEGENGFVVPAGDIEALADRLVKLLSDEELRKEMGEASREIIAGWDLDACVEGVRDALRSVSRGSRRGGRNRHRETTLAGGR